MAGSTPDELSREVKRFCEPGLKADPTLLEVLHAGPDGYNCLHRNQQGGKRPSRPPAVLRRIGLLLSPVGLDKSRQTPQVVDNPALWSVSGRRFGNDGQADQMLAQLVAVGRIEVVQAQPAEVVLRNFA